MVAVVFAVVFLVVLSWSADRYHSYLKRFDGFELALKQPNAKKELIYSDRAKLREVLNRHKKKSYWLLLIVFGLHILVSLGTQSDFFRYSVNSSDPEIWSPYVFGVGSLLILRVIFWLKGKGGGVPNNRGLNRPGPGGYWP